MGIIILLAVAWAGLTVVGAVLIVYTMHHPERRTYAHALARRLPLDPSEVGLAYDEQTFHFRDGTATTGWVIQGQNPSGPVVAITHGWNSSRYGALVHASILAPFASRVVVYDMRGHGESTARTCQLGAAESDDLFQVIDQLDDDQPPLVLMGISMGAGITLAAAGSVLKTASEAIRRRVVGVIVEGPYRHPMEPVVGHLQCRKLPPYPLVWLAELYYRLVYADYPRFDRVRHAANLACPLLVLHGTDDPICRFESGRKIAEAAPQGELIAFSGAGHSGLIDLDRPRYHKALKEFFEQAAASSVQQQAVKIGV